METRSSNATSPDSLGGPSARNFLHSMGEQVGEKGVEPFLQFPLKITLSLIFPFIFAWTPQLDHPLPLQTYVDGVR
jgi:hypothetical protein